MLNTSGIRHNVPVSDTMMVQGIINGIFPTFWVTTGEDIPVWSEETYCIVPRSSSSAMIGCLDFQYKNSTVLEVEVVEAFGIASTPKVTQNSKQRKEKINESGSGRLMQLNLTECASDNKEKLSIRLTRDNKSGSDGAWLLGRPMHANKMPLKVEFQWAGKTSGAQGPWGNFRNRQRRYYRGRDH